MVRHSGRREHADFRASNQLVVSYKQTGPVGASHAPTGFNCLYGRSVKAFLTGEINTGTKFDSTDFRGTNPRLSQSANTVMADNLHGIQSPFSNIKVQRNGTLKPSRK
jgi:hypothetical protein